MKRAICAVSMAFLVVMISGAQVITTAAGPSWIFLTPGDRGDNTMGTPTDGQVRMVVSSLLDFPPVEGRFNFSPVQASSDQDDGPLMSPDGLAAPQDILDIR